MVFSGGVTPLCDMVRFLYLLLASFLLAFAVAEPVRAFTSLQSCYQRPACAKMLIDAGMVGSSTAPASVVTTPTAATAVAGGASPASSIAIPQLLADGAALATGVAALVVPWNQDKADELGKKYAEPFEGGQCPGVTYSFFTQAYFDGEPVGKRVQRNAVGPIGKSALDLPTGKGVKVTDGNGDIVGEPFSPATASVSDSSRSVDIEITDMTGPEDCGNPSPELEPNQVPSPSQMGELFGPPQEVPFPPAQPGPDGELGTDDDIYPPLTLPGPHISPDVGGDPRYSPNDFSLPNPLASPGSDPSSGEASDPDADPGSESEPFPRELFEGDWTEPDAVPDAEFSAPHFIPHALAVFSDKFPLDVLGQLPDPGEKVCPIFEFFDEPFEFCIVNDALDAVKIPTLVGFVIWAVMAL